MTKEEAIKRFETLLLHVDTDCVMGMETTEAINMAIKALEQPEIIYCKDCRYCIYTPEAPNEHRPNETYPELWHCCFHKVYMPYMSLVQPDGYCNNAKKRRNKG